MSFYLHLLSTTLLLAISGIHAQSIAPSLASQYSLSSSTTLPFPTATLSSTDTADLLKSKWSLAKAKVQQGQDNMAFVADPFPSSSSSSSPVLQVTYPQGSFSHDTGGTQFINLFNGTTPFNSMLLTYDLAFDKDFQFVKGGKLPGLRGGSQLDGCSGGKASDGVECFSTRLMWRDKGAGEVYAYIPDQSSLCSNSAIQCNDDGFGTSIQRGRISFLPGQWQSLALFVQMNEPADTANGYIALYYNDVKAIEQGGLQIRTSEDLNIGGMYFSTFFGGDDDSWATPITTHTYYKNIQLFAGAGASTMQGNKISSAPQISGASVIPLLVGTVAARLLSSGMW